MDAALTYNPSNGTHVMFLDAKEPNRADYRYYQSPHVIENLYMVNVNTLNCRGKYNLTIKNSILCGIFGNIEDYINLENCVIIT